MFIAVIAILAMSVSIWAAQKNPLAEMPTTTATVWGSAASGMGCDYFTPEYDAKVKISVKSYNTKVVTIKAYTFKSTSGKNFAGYETTKVAPGSTKIKVKVAVGSKSYTKICKYTVYKWENPLKTFKIGSVNYCPKLNKTSTVTLTENALSGKITYKLNPNYTLVSMSCNAREGDKYSTVNNIKSGKNLPKGTYNISLRIKSKKNNQFYNVMIYVPQK